MAECAVRKGFPSARLHNRRGGNHLLRIGLFAAIAFVVLTCGAASASTCNTTIYGVVEAGGLYQFTPPTATATAVAGNPTLPFGTIARGVYSGNIYIVSGTTSNSPLYTYDLTARVQKQVGTFPNTSFLYASGFSITGVGYAMSSSETFSYTDGPTPVITRLGAPQTTSGPPITAFNSGDLAIDLTNNGWIVLSNNSTGLSYLYRVSFGTPTILIPVAQISLNGKAYTTGDLYSLAFGGDGTLYTSSGNNGTLYTINLSTGALTSLGAQGQKLVDFASCPFAPQPYVTKSGPTQSAHGELIYYAITAANSATATVTATNLTLQDPVPAGITIRSATCTGTGGATCTAPTTAGQTITTTIATLPPNSSVTLSIYGLDATLPIGTTTNTAVLTSAGGIPFSAPSTVNVIANSVTKTVANITQSTAASGTANNGIPGDVLEYVLTYTNATNSPLSSFKLNDTIPPNTTYVSGSAACTTTPTGLTCAPSGPTAGAITWSFSGGTLAPGQSVTVKYRVTID